MKRAFKILAWILGIPIILFLLLGLSLQFKGVQNFLTTKITQSLSNQLKSKIEIAKVEFRFFKSVDFTGVYVEDSRRDTLLALDQLSASIGLFSLLGKNIQLEDVLIKGLRTNLYTQQKDSTFNFQYIIDHFSAEPSKEEKESSPWTIGFGNIDLQNTQFSFQDSIGQIYLHTQIPSIRIHPKQIDLVQKKIDLSSLIIDQPQLNIETFIANQKKTKDDTSPLTFPFTGWLLAADQIQIKQGDIRYWVNNKAVKTGSLDTDHLHFSPLQLEVEAFYWDAISLQLQLKELAFEDQNGLTVNDTRAFFALSPQSINIKDLSLSTPSSKVKNSSSLSFDNWAALPDFLQQVNYTSQFSNCQLSLQDLEFFIPYFPEDYRIKNKIYLNGTLRGEKSNVVLDNLQLQIGDYLDFQSSGQLNTIDQVDQLKVDLDLKKLTINYKKFREALPVLKLPALVDSLGLINISGGIQGSLAQMNLQNFFLGTSTNTFLKASGGIKNLSTPKAISFKLNIDTLHTKAEDLAYFATAPLAPGLYEMNSINYKGLLEGDLFNFDSKGKLSTSIGLLESDLSISFNPSYSNASYDGNIQLQNFNLGLFLGDTATFGMANLEASIDGKGLVLDSMNTTIEAKVNGIDFSKYEYQNIEINGSINQLEFTGFAGIKDPNFTFDFEGLVNLQETNPTFNFQADIDTLDLYALGLSPLVLRTSATIKSDFSGNNIDDFLGKATINNLAISNDTIDFFSDSLVIKAQKKGSNNKELLIRSDWLKADFGGEFYFSTLSPLMKKLFHEYFPIENFLSPTNHPDSFAIEPLAQADLPDQNLNFKIKFIQPDKLSQLFTPVLEKADSISFNGAFDSADKNIKLALSAPNLVASGWKFDSLNWLIEGDAKQINSVLNIPKADNGTMLFRSNKVHVNIADQILVTDILINNRIDESVFEWGAKLSPAGEKYQLTFRDSLLVDQVLWTLRKDHDILFSDEYLHIKDFTLNKNEHHVSTSSTQVSTSSTQVSILKHEKSKAEDYSPLELIFQDFQLKELSALSSLENFDYNGLLNGKIQVNDLTDNLHYLADIQVNDVQINDTLIGNFIVQAEQNSNAPEVNIQVELNGNGNDFQANGTYNLESNEFDIKADIKQLPLLLIDPFTLGAIKNSKGSVGGKFIVRGTPDVPIVKGQLTFTEASTRINYLQTRYSIRDHTIDIKENGIDFGKLGLFDLQGNKALLSGTIQHQNFDRFHLNLDFKTDNFKFLNTLPKDNDLFYGTLNLAADVKIRGTLELPKMTINASTQKGSQLFVKAISEEELSQQAAYIIFGKPGEIPLDSLLLVRDKGAYERNLEIDLLLNLELNPKAELIVVIDPSSGDELRCKGNADITVLMSPAGDINITGIYTVVEGTYQFNYQGLVKRSFNLVPGGQLNFIGDPMQTRFDLTAKYQTRTSLYTLISNESTLSESATREAKERSDVEVLLTMKGNLDQPQISFDLNVPETNNATIGSVTTQKLAQLKDDESELNKQVFGLLLLNSFVAEQSATASLSTTGENIALSSVSNLISNQLNRLSDQYVKGLGLTFELESNRDQFSDQSSSTTTRTNLNVGLTQSLFNDRLNLKVGGVASIENNSESGTASRLSNIAGDFVLEYQLTKSGNYLLRVFQRSDYDAFNDSNVSKTGVGVSFKKSFGK